MLAAVRGRVSPEIERHGPIEAWIIDDTDFPKKGKHSVGVEHSPAFSRQYCGQLGSQPAPGKQDNCQVAVSLSVANEAASLPIDYRLYLPKDWAGDPVRRAKAGVPDEITFQTKPSMALDQIRKAVANGMPPGVVLADVGYGANMKFQAGLRLTLPRAPGPGVKVTFDAGARDDKSTEASFYAGVQRASGRAVF